MFTLSLDQWLIILAISIKSSTIKGYLRAKASLLKYTDLSNPTKNFEGKLANYM